MTEACTQAQSLVEAGEEITGEILSRLVKLKMSAARDECMEIKAAEQRAKEAELDAKVHMQGNPFLS